MCAGTSRSQEGFVPKASQGCLEPERRSDEHHSLGCAIHTFVHVRGQTQTVTDAKAELK